MPTLREEGGFRPLPLTPRKRGKWGGSRGYFFPPYTQGHGGTLRGFAYRLPFTLGSLPCPIFKGFG